MNIFDSVLCFLDGFRKYFDFKGRATRSAYFSFFAINGLIATFLFGHFHGFSSIQPLIQDPLIIPLALISFIFMPGFLLLAVGVFELYILFTMIPFFAYCTRRLHDAGYSGAWQILYVIPVIGPLIVFALTLKASDGDNKYGAAEDATGASILMKLRNRRLQNASSHDGHQSTENQTPH